MISIRQIETCRNINNCEMGQASAFWSEGADPTAFPSSQAGGICLERHVPQTITMENLGSVERKMWFVTNGYTGGIHCRCSAPFALAWAITTRSPTAAPVTITPSATPTTPTAAPTTATPTAAPTESMKFEHSEIANATELLWVETITHGLAPMGSKSWRKCYTLPHHFSPKGGSCARNFHYAVLRQISGHNCAYLRRPPEVWRYRDLIVGRYEYEPGSRYSSANQRHRTSICLLGHTAKGTPHERYVQQICSNQRIVEAMQCVRARTGHTPRPTISQASVWAKLGNELIYDA